MNLEEETFIALKNLERPEAYHLSIAFILQMQKWVKKEHVPASERTALKDEKETLACGLRPF